MNIEDLQEIRSEVKRFLDTIDEGITVARVVPGYHIGDSKTLYGKHDISGTRLSGAIKRIAIDLKYYLKKTL